MKKTIITATLCLGLASTASAADEALTLSSAVLEIQDYDPSGSWAFAGEKGEDGTAKNLSTIQTRPSSTMMFVFDWEKLKSTTFTLDESTNTYSPINVAALYSANPANESNKGYASFSIVKVGDDLHAWTAYAGTARSELTSDLSAYVSQGKLVLTLATGDGSTLYAANTTSSASVADSGLKVSTKITYTHLGVFSSALENSIDSIYVFDHILDESAIKTLSGQAISAAVPEPATATLSLLALAGLATRRRRK